MKLELSPIKRKIITHFQQATFSHLPTTEKSTRQTCAFYICKCNTSKLYQRDVEHVKERGVHIYICASVQAYTLLKCSDRFLRALQQNRAQSRLSSALLSIFKINFNSNVNISVVSMLYTLIKYAAIRQSESLI